MNEIKALFERLLEEPAPPLPTSEAVIAAGRQARSRRARQAVTGWTALTLAVVLAAIGLNLAGRGGSAPPLPPVALPSASASPAGQLKLTATDFDQAEMLFVASTSDAVGGGWFGTWAGTAPLTWYLTYVRIMPGGPCENPAAPQPFPRPFASGSAYSCVDLPDGDTTVWVVRWEGPALTLIQVHVPLSAHASVVYTVSNVDLMAWSAEPTPPASAGPAFSLSDAEVISLARTTISPSNLPIHLSLSEYLLG